MELQTASPSSTSADLKASNPAGLTNLHIAAINNSRDEVRSLLASKENAVDERTPKGATALMLASLYGRFDMFMYLLKKGASMPKQDYEGLGCIDYVKHSPSVKLLLQDYKVVAIEQPRRSGRKAIFEFLRSFVVRGALRSHMASTPPVVNDQMERRIVSLRKGGVFEIVEVRSLALAEWGNDLGRKTCAAVRGQDEAVYRAIATSGWRGDEAMRTINANKCLNNAEYLKLIRNFAKVVGYKIQRNWLDNRFSGSLSEKDGAFLACHAEKQLAIHILRASMAHALRNSDITTENMAKLKLAVDGGLGDLQTEFIIELEHKPCNCCITFLKLIYEKSGLRFNWLQREWFSEGRRSRLKVKDGLRASPKNLSTFEDEVDEGDDDWQLPCEDDADEDWVVVKTPKTQNRQTREYEMPTKAGSEVGEEDFPFPSQKTVSKRLGLISSQKQQQKKLPRRLASHQIPSRSLTVSPATSKQDTKGPITPINFEIPIRTVARSVVPEPFPGAVEWVSSFGSEEME